MTVRLEAPYNAVSQITVLPNPSLDDSEGMDVQTLVRKSMNGLMYSYISKPESDSKVYTLTWDNIARGKILEVIEFIELFGAGFIKMVDHRSRIWKVLLETNPNSFIMEKRADPVGYGESGSFTLVFVGKIVGTES